MYVATCICCLSFYAFCTSVCGCILNIQIYVSIKLFDKAMNIFAQKSLSHLAKSDESYAFVNDRL